MTSTADKPEPTEEFKRFDKAMDKIMSVSKEELNHRLKVAKETKVGKRYPKDEQTLRKGV